MGMANDCPIRFIQKLLGHVKLETTTIYTNSLLKNAHSGDLTSRRVPDEVLCGLKASIVRGA